MIIQKLKAKLKLPIFLNNKTHIYKNKGILKERHEINILIKNSVEFFNKGE